MIGPTLTELKSILRQELAKRGLSVAGLAKAMNRSRTSADRVVSLSHASTVDQMDAAFHALGMQDAMTEVVRARCNGARP